MTFKKGQSGNPKGRPPDKLFRDMLVLALNDAKAKKPKLRRIAEKLVNKAVGGDMAAIKEVADRLDGKPSQIIMGSGEGGVHRHELIFRPVKP